MPQERHAREDLILAHVAWARRVAVRAVRKRRLVISFEDARSAADLALVEAAGRYRPETGVDFGAYAHRRIIGAVQDASYQLAMAWRHVAGGPRLFPVADVNIENLRRVLVAPDSTRAAEARVLLTSLLSELQPREREVLRMIYVDDLCLKDVGAELGVSESRVCQIATKAIKRLRGGVETDAEAK